MPGLENKLNSNIAKTPEKPIDDSVRGQVERELGVPQSLTVLENESTSLQIKNKDGEYLSYVISVDGNFASEVTVQEGKRYNSSDQKDLHYVNSSATVDEVERSDKSGNPRNLRAISQQLGGSKLALVTSYLEELKSKK